MLVSLKSLSYTPYASFSEEFHTHSWRHFSAEFLLHSSWWFCLVRGFSCTPRSHSVVLMSSFSYTSDDRFSSVWSFPYTLDASFSEEVLLHSWCQFQWGGSLTLLMPVSVRRFSYTPDASFSEEVPWLSWCQFQWRGSLTLLMPVSVKRFPYTPDASFSEEVPLHSWCQFQWRGSMTLLMPVSVKRFPYTPDASFSEVFHFHRLCSMILVRSFVLHSSFWVVLVRSFSYTPQDGSV